MKGVFALFFTLALFFAVISAQENDNIIVISNTTIIVTQPIQNYAMLTFWADSSCSQFAGLKGITKEPQTLQGTSDQPCEIAMRCLNNPSSYGCYAISHQNNDPQSSINATIYDTIITVEENGVSTNYTSIDCVESSLYANCFFKYYTQNEFASVWTGTFVIAVPDAQPEKEQDEENSSSLLFPSLLLLTFSLFFY